MWDVVWREPTDLTPEEIKARADQLTKDKAEWLKKAKKKKWTDEMEKELVEDYKRKLNERVGNNVLE